MFAFEWLLAYSDAHTMNSTPLVEADCSGAGGGDEPRDLAHDSTGGKGWFAKHIDRSFILSMANDPEVKGLVFSSISSGNTSHLWRDTSVYSRDQDGGLWGPYLAIYATYEGDCDNDGSVDVVDLLTMVDTWGLQKGDPGFDPECDLNCDDSVDVVDLLILAGDFGNSLQ